MKLSHALSIAFSLALVRCKPDKNGSPDAWVMV